MASVIIVFRKDKKTPKGKVPIHLRIIRHRKVSYISTGISIEEKFWDETNNKIKSTVKNSGRLNNYIQKKYSDLQNEILKINETPNSYSSRQLKEKVLGKEPKDFFEFAAKINDVFKKAGKIGTFDRYNSIIQKFKDYVKGPIFFNEITPSYLNEYELHLSQNLNNKINTITGNLKLIKKIFGEAVRLDIIDYSSNPFLKIKLKLESVNKDYLTEEEIERIENLLLTPGTKMEIHRDMFIFACYVGGVRVSDMLTLQIKNITDTHLTFIVRKTGKQQTLKLPDKAKSILKKYVEKNTNQKSFLFPILPANINLNDPQQMDTAISRGTAYINKNLKIIATKANIEKNVSFHVSRHTFATRFLRMGAKIELVSKALGHSAIKETQIYAKIIDQELDNAMDIFNK
jgi:integrase/recombinase XerD